jgi:ribosomal protein L12E/L44/L45/RPP1/RPP2
MKYELDNGRTINIPDKDIERLQKSLNISYNEAVYTWLVDEEYITDETVEELSEKAKKNRITATVHQAKADNSQKKERKPREKKENPLKKQIISGIHDYFLDEIGHIFPKDTTITVRNDEKYIDLCVDGLEFTINLVQHRAKK